MLSSLALVSSLVLLLFLLLRKERKLNDGPFLIIALLLALLALLLSSITVDLAAPSVFVSLFLSLGLFATLRFIKGSGDSSSLGPFILWPVVLTALLPTVYLFVKGGRHSLVSGGMSTLHLWLVTAASCASAMAFGAGFALALQDYCLKTKRPLPQTITVPSLAAADSAVYQLAGLTFALLTLSIIAATTTIGKAWGSWRWEPRTLGALLLWLLYGLGLHMRRIAGWRGQRFGTIVMSGFLLILLVFIVMHLKVVS